MNKNFEKLVTTISVFTDTLVPLTESPFKVADDTAMKDLTESIKKFGILEPITVRKPDNTAEGKFEIISGYRRFEVCKDLEIKSVLVRVLNISRDDAIIAMIDSNLCHRENILPSEKAKAYQMKLEAMKRQGYRTDLESDITSAQVERKLESAEILARESDDSRAQIRRYIRLNNLHPELLKMVDEKKIAFTPAVELSYLTPEEQKNLLETIKSEDCTPSASQAQNMKKLSQIGALDMDEIFSIMTTPKPNQQEMVKIPIEEIRKYAPKVDNSRLVEHIMKALEYYNKALQKQRNRDRDAR